MRLRSLLAFLCSLGLLGCAAGDSSAYVTGNVPLGADCTADKNSQIILASGLYDVGSPSTPQSCVHSYYMNLQIQSQLKSNADMAVGRAEPNVLQVTHAIVRLMDKNQGTMMFKSTPTHPLPNPFRVETATSLPPTLTTIPNPGIASIEAIPQAYASSLATYKGETILVEAQLYGTTTGNIEIEFQPFVFPVAICGGCLSYCTPTDPAVTKMIGTLTTGKCLDNAAQDDRICVADCP